MKTYTHRARQTGHMVTVISAVDAGLDTGTKEFATRWYTICEQHDEATGHPTCDIAREWASEPATWCESCRDEVFASNPSNGPAAKETEACDHNCDWDHEYDPDSVLGDAYYCSRCGELTQVG